MNSNTTNADIFKTSCIDEGNLSKSEYKMFRLQINKDNETQMFAGKMLGRFLKLLF